MADTSSSNTYSDNTYSNDTTTNNYSSTSSSGKPVSAQAQGTLNNAAGTAQNVGQNLVNSKQFSS